MSAEPSSVPSPNGEGDFEAPDYNPHRDGAAAKLWELLRRNAEFRGTAAAIVKKARSRDANKREQALVEPRQIRESNPFAGVALEWLCPQPTFIYERCKIDREGKPANFDLVWEGTKPNPPPLSSPEWREIDDTPTHSARVLRPGPTIRKFDDDTEDAFQIWREDAKKFPPFTTSSAWPQTPRLFRSAFSFEWRHFEHGLNSHTGQADIGLEETHFFEGWRLQDFDPTTVEGAAKWLEFDELARCRVFAIPKLRYTSASEIQSMLDALSKLLKAELVRREEIFGTETQWKVFLEIERNQAQCEKDGDPFSLSAAIDQAGESLYSKKYDSGHRKEIVQDYWRAMDAPASGDGWIQKVFPNLPAEIFATQKPSAS